MEKLGSGSDVCVYKYLSPLSPVAIKRITKEADELIESRLQTEAEYLQRFDHPNIVAYRELVLHPAPSSPSNRLSILMEYCDTSIEKLIEDRLQSSNPIPFLPSRVLTVALHIGPALAYIHNTHHLLHGDLKSANVLVSGDFKEVKLCDFGVCVRLNPNNKGQKHPDLEVYQGTEQWWPKETLHNLDPDDITDRTDIYPYGLILWEMVTLEVPHEWIKKKDKENEYKEDNEELEAKYKATLGTCPPMPTLKKNYKPIIDLITCCCNENWKDRPPASRIVKVLEELIDDKQ